MKSFVKKVGKAGNVVLALTMVCVMVVLCGCSQKEPAQEELPVIKLSVWSDERNFELLDEVIEEFKETYKDEAVFDFVISAESELTCKETVLSNPQKAADVYTFADDQFEELWQAGALLEITEDTDIVMEENGGAQSGACMSCMRDGKLFAYPKTAGNGYFLYYNSSYFTEEDIKSLDRILEICAENDKKMAMDFSSGWYIYSFFKGAGLELTCNEDGVSNSCNWNATDTKYKGTDVAEAMLAVAGQDGFLNCGDDAFIRGVQDGSIIAGVNGPWNASTIEAAWGKHYAAAMLPEYTIAGDSVQMCSFTGYKLVGVNAYSENPEWAMRFARMITNEENQIKRFQSVGECPSNVNATQSAQVQSAPAIAALGEQARYGYVQSVADTFWDPSSIFGITIAAGNPDGQDIQELLDTMVEKITARPEN